MYVCSVCACECHVEGSVPGCVACSSVCNVLLCVVLWEKDVCSGTVFLDVCFFFCDVSYVKRFVGYVRCGLWEAFIYGMWHVAWG